ncbi:MAG: hypothetical protein AB7F86_09895 [Bdellovibrionales bacterium]
MWLPLLILWVGLADAKSSPPKKKEVCTKRELKAQDCRLYVGPYNLRLLNATIAWFDGTWRTVDDMPLKGEGLDWEKVRFEFLNGWPILQLYIWDQGEGEAKVQNLHWFVIDAEKQKVTLLSKGIVRQRRVKRKDFTLGEDGGEEKPAEGPPRYIYDKWEEHSLKARAKGGLDWRLKKEHKTFERVAHGV